MIIDSQSVPEAAQDSSLPDKVFFSKAGSPGVLGAKTVSLSSLRPPTVLAHSRYSVGFMWLVPELSPHCGPRWAIAVAAEGRERSLGQGSFSRVRNGFAIACVPCQAVSSSLHTLTPHPGFIFPAKSPDRTWPGASLSEAATPRQACR